MRDLRKNLSPKTRREAQVQLDRILEFQEMDTAAMASALLSASRCLIDSGMFNPPLLERYWNDDDWALYRCIPALAVCLDPTVDLRPREEASHSHGWDPLTDVIMGEYDALFGTLDIMTARTLFREACFGDEDVRMAASFLHDRFGRWSAIKIAMDTVSPGTHPERVTAVAQEPLTGYQLISTYGEHDRVELYAENIEDLREPYRVAAAKRQTEDLSQDEEKVLRRLRSWPERLDFDALSIRSVDGKIFEAMEVSISEAEIDAGPQILPPNY